MIKKLFFLSSVAYLLLFTACNGNDSNADVVTTSETNEEVKESVNETEDIYHENWTGLTEEGLNEDEFIADMDQQVLETVATELQTLCDNIAEKQLEDPDSVLRGDWVSDVIESEEYNHVINLGEKAMKPLYYIIYKSQYQGMYEYVCSLALQEIFGIELVNDDGTSWATSKEFLDLFTKTIIR